MLDYRNLVRNIHSLNRYSIKLALSLVFVSVMSVFFVDQQLAQFFANKSLAFFWLWNREITNIALSEPYFIISLLGYIFCRWIALKIPNLVKFSSQIQNYRIWFGQFFVSLFTSGFMVHLLKNSIGRQRPHKTPDFNALVFDPFHFHWDNHSMPSGHAQVCFTVATMLVLMFPKKWKLIFVLASILAFTRAVVHAHFLSDVVVGALVGNLTTLYTVYYLSKRQQPS